MQLLAESKGDKMFKIGKHLAKLYERKISLDFLTHSV